LDLVQDMPLEAQTRLLRVLQEREVTRVGGRDPVRVDVRIVAATHRDLAARVSEGGFRQDLMYRLDVVRIMIPPLRERRDDIPGLVAHFSAKHAARHKTAAPIAPPELLERLSRHSWPGNVRELENLVERAVVLGSFHLAARSPLAEQETPALASSSAGRAPSSDEVRPLRDAVADAERRAVVAALKKAAGNKAEAARLLGISYKTLFNKIHEHGIKEELQIE
jgi:DNA-binding NtrC family response regulator